MTKKIEYKMKNDTLRIQGYQQQYSRGLKQGGPEWMDGSELRLQQSTLDETYTDGYVDYTHEI